MLADTHCHIHAAGQDSGEEFTARKWNEAGEVSAANLAESAGKAGVTRLICVGTDLEDSQNAVEFAARKEGCWSSIGIHPHDASLYVNSPDKLQKIRNLMDKDKVVAVGEVGLDYYYEHSIKKDQIKLLELMLQMAADNELPVIFHVRDAYSDFWPIADNFKKIKGVLHSFSAHQTELNQALTRDFYIGLNGIMTFTKDQSQLAAAKAVPFNRLVLETDAPYLTPKPFRGKVCKPEHVVNIAEFLCDLRGENFEQFAQVTTKNAQELFNLA